MQVESWRYARKSSVTGTNYTHLLFLCYDQGWVTLCYTPTIIFIDIHILPQTNRYLFLQVEVHGKERWKVSIVVVDITYCCSSQESMYITILLWYNGTNYYYSWWIWYTRRLHTNLYGLVLSRQVALVYFCVKYFHKTHIFKRFIEQKKFKVMVQFLQQKLHKT